MTPVCSLVLALDRLNFLLLIGPVLKLPLLTTNAPSGQLAASHKNHCATVCLFPPVHAQALSAFLYASTRVCIFVSVCSRACIHVCARSHVVCRFAPSHLSASVGLFCLVVVHTVPTLLPPFISSLALCVCLIVSPSHFTRQESPRQLLSICSPPRPFFSLSPHIHNSAIFLFSVSSTKSVFMIRFLLSIADTLLYLCFVYRGGGVVAQSSDLIFLKGNEQFISVLLKPACSFAMCYNVPSLSCIICSLLYFTMAR